MTYVAKEIPSWVIDWVNKVFTLLNDVDYISDVYYDWVITTDFTRVDKVITLTYAPTLSIFVDYNTTTADSIVSTTCTFWDIKEKVWALLWAKSTSTNFSDTIVANEINLQGRTAWKGRMVNKLNPSQIFRAWYMYFKDKSYVIRVKADNVPLTADVAVWDTTIDLVTDNLLWAWYIELWWDYIKYTSTSATQLLWVSGITIEHLIWEEVAQLYEAPLLIDKPSSVEKITTGKSYDIPYNLWNIRYEVIKYTETLIKIVWLEVWDIVRVNYIEQYSNMGLDTDNCPFPEEYWISVLAYLTAGALGYEKWIPNSQYILNSWYNSLQEMYSDIWNETNIVVQSIKPTFSNYIKL